MRPAHGSRAVGPLLAGHPLLVAWDVSILRPLAHSLPQSKVTEQASDPASPPGAKSPDTRKTRQCRARDECGVGVGPHGPPDSRVEEERTSESDLRAPGLSGSYGE